MTEEEEAEVVEHVLSGETICPKCQLWLTDVTWLLSRSLPATCRHCYMTAVDDIYYD